jgi:hypothetical protein
MLCPANHQHTLEESSGRKERRTGSSGEDGGVDERCDDMQRLRNQIRGRKTVTKATRVSDPTSIRSEQRNIPRHEWCFGIIRALESREKTVREETHRLFVRVSLLNEGWDVPSSPSQYIPRVPLVWPR